MTIDLVNYVFDLKIMVDLKIVVNQVLKHGQPWWSRRRDKSNSVGFRSRNPLAETALLHVAFLDFSSKAFV